MLQKYQDGPMKVIKASKAKLSYALQKVKAFFVKIKSAFSKFVGLMQDYLSNPLSTRAHKIISAILLVLGSLSAYLIGCKLGLKIVVKSLELVRKAASAGRARINTNRFGFETIGPKRV